MKTPRFNSSTREFIAWWFCVVGIFAAGFGFAPLLTDMPWLAGSIWCLAVALIWIGWEIEKAVNEEDAE